MSVNMREGGVQEADHGPDGTSGHAIEHGENRGHGEGKGGQPPRDLEGPWNYWVTRERLWLSSPPKGVGAGVRPKVNKPKWFYSGT